MVKNLFLVRHAKSDWSDPGQKDFDRELNSRGVLDAPRMGRKLYEMSVQPEVILASPARRAKLTAEYLAEQLHYDLEKIEWKEEIYEASVRSLLAVINEIPDTYNNAMVVGHNPTLTYLAEYLTKQPFENIPTCGMVNIKFEIDSWKTVSADMGSVEWFIYPKNTLS